MRVRQLEQVQQRFAVQQHRVVDLERKIDETRTLIREQLKPQPLDNVDPMLSQQRFRYVQYLKQQAEHLTQAHRHEAAVLEKIREEMRQAHVKKRSLELLEEKQRKAYIRQLESQEEKEIEDIVVSRLSRN